MKRRTFAAILVAAALLSSAAAPAQQPAPRVPTATRTAAIPAGPPQLVVVISVDQFSSDLFAEYRPHFTGGLRRLADQGVVFPSGFQAHAATETCPGHSTILTGSRPGRTGIIANTWFNPASTRADKAIYCAEDERVPGSTSSNYTVSDLHLRVPALGEYMRRQLPGARTVSVAGKDRAAVMMAGHDPEQIWWWNGRTFASYAGRQAPQTLDRANAAIATRLAAARAPLEVPPLCAAKGRAVPVGTGERSVGSSRLERAAGDRNAFRASPEFDASVLAIGAGLREELQLGQGSRPDLLILGLSATDYVGHTFGTQGQEMCLQLMGLDRELGDFLNQLDRSRLDYMVVLTADHGGVDIPERAAQEGRPDAVRVDPRLNAGTMGREIGGRLGLQGPVLYGDGAFGDIYVDTALPAAARTRVRAEALRAYRAHPQVAAAFTREDIRAAAMPSGDPQEWTLLQRARASFDAERSGDFVVLLKPAVTPIADVSRGYVATHGSPYDYDRRVPILFWRRGLPAFEQPLAIETADILPTVASILGISVPAAQIDGVCRDIIEGPQSSCR